MRLTALLLLLFAFVTARATDVLVLIDPADAGPKVPTSDYIHPLWILWPAEAGKNQLMSLPTGMDWRARVGDDFFDETGHPLAASTLAERGYFEAVKRYLGDLPVTALADRHGNFAPSTLQVALTQLPKVRTASWNGPLPEGLVVTTVQGRTAWDDLATIAHRANGVVMVVELPAKGGVTWSRVWLKNWTEDLPSFQDIRIPGLIPASKAIAFLTKPDRREWTKNDTYRWGGANRWLEYGHYTAPVFLVFVGVVAIYIAGCAVYCIVREEKGRLALFLLRLLLLGPAMLVLAGSLTSLGMVSEWPGWFVASAVIVALLAYGVNTLAKRLFKELHPLAGEMWVGFWICLFVDPVWSVFSHVLGPHPVAVSPEVYGALCAYAVGSVAFLRSEAKLDYLFANQWALLLISMFFCVWIPGKPELSTFICIAGLSMFKWGPAIFSGYMILNEVFIGGLAGGIGYAASDLYASFRESKALNLADHVAFFASPAFIGFALFVLIVWIAGDRFLTHQIRRSLAFNRQPLALVRAAIAFFPLGLVAPIFLYAFLACAMAAATCVLFDAVRAP